MGTTIDQSAATLILIASAAFVLPLVGRRLRVPAVVLEIVFGVIIGPATGWVEGTELLDQLGELGFFLLMFLSGFEIDLRTFERRGFGQITAGLAVFALTLVGAYVAATSLGYGLFMTFVLATTSVGLVVPTLRATRRISTPLGQAILVSALLADFLTLLAVTEFALIEEEGAGLPLLAVPGFFLVIGIALLALRRAAWWFPERFNRLFDQDDPDELGIRASLALMLVFVGLSTVLGIEAILGAFLAGTMFALVFRHRGALEQKLSGFAYGFLIPIFFINVGIQFDLKALGEPGAITGALVLIGVAFLVKMVPSLVLLARRLSLRDVIAAGTLLSARLSLIIAVAELGVQLGVIDRALQASIILLAVVTSTLAPAVFRLIAPPLPVTSTVADDDETDTNS
jgi:Kef-type K+ transport system membrane component KefB